MGLKLVKTVSCNNCNSTNFSKMGIAWNCSDCGLYMPAQLKDTSLEKFKLNIEEMTKKQAELKKMLADLDKLLEQK